MKCAPGPSAPGSTSGLPVILAISSPCLDHSCSTSKRGGAPARSAGRTTTWVTNFSKRCSIPICSTPAPHFAANDDLAAAQRRKLEAICQKLRLRPGIRLLDIGCGWGGFARYAAHHYACRVVGITISREQQRYAEQLCRGLDVEIRLQDYREIRDQFDRAVSVGMIEHVGYRNYRAYRRAVCRSLGEDGLWLGQGIAATLSRFELDPWLRRYIFLNSVLPSLSRLARAAGGLFFIEGLDN